MSTSPQIQAEWAELPVADDDRHLVIDRLRHLVGTDLIDLDQFESLAAAVWCADSFGELDALLAAAPLPSPPTAGRGRVLGRFGAGRRGAGWRPMPLTSAVAAFGNVRLDLTEADWDGRMLCIDAVAVCGGIDVVVPRGVDVTCEGPVVVTGPRAVVPLHSIGRASPQIRVFARSVFGHVSVRRHPFRSWVATG